MKKYLGVLVALALVAAFASGGYADTATSPPGVSVSPSVPNVAGVQGVTGGVPLPVTIPSGGIPTSPPLAPNCTLGANASTAATTVLPTYTSTTSAITVNAYAVVALSSTAVQASFTCIGR